MNQKIALKRLTASDLTFFEWHFRNRNAGNQKAINLNADVFVTKLFPAIEAATRGEEGKLPLDLWVCGPGGAPALNLQRKIIKWGAYKNWRLNGEFIVNPVDDPERFNSLQPGDYVVIAFEGDVVPISATTILVAHELPRDTPLHDALGEVLGQAKMLALDEPTLERLVANAQLSADHPLVGLTISEELKEVSLGSARATQRLLRSRRTARLSKAELKRARDAAEETGRLGEQLVAIYLQRRKDAGEIAEFEWTSDVNAVSPFDFRVRSAGVQERVDVKTTSGPFSRELHVSTSELFEMAAGGGPYRIFRVYEATPEGAHLRVSDDMKHYAEIVLEALRGLPAGVTADSVSIDPHQLSFEGPVWLDATEENEDGE